MFYNPHTVSQLHEEAILRIGNVYTMLNPTLVTHPLD